MFFCSRNLILGSPDPNNFYARGTTTHLVESLQTQLKQREGEMVQLQMELSSLERLRDNMYAELTRMTQKVKKFELLEVIEEELLSLESTQRICMKPSSQ